MEGQEKRQSSPDGVLLIDLAHAYIADLENRVRLDQIAETTLERR